MDVLSAQDEHAEHGAFLRDFDDVELGLTSKYGTADVRTVWQNSLYKTDPQRWGMAVAAGHLTQSSTRNPTAATIFHMLRGDNFKIDHVVIYTGIEYAGALDVEGRKAKTDGL